MDTWTEVNIIPAGDPDLLVTEVAAPLVSDLNGYWNAWHYFWEDDPEPPHMRLRFRWAHSREREVFDFLDENTLVSRWYAGAHGIEGETYAGEHDLYGAVIWEDMVHAWTGFSDLALSMAAMEKKSLLPKSRSFYWSRIAHLTANQSHLDDVKVYLRQAQRYMERPGCGDPASREVLYAIDRYLTGEKVTGDDPDERVL